MKPKNVSSFRIDEKDYVVLSKKDYETLLARAASKTPPAKKLSLTEGKKLAYKLIDKWSDA